MWFCFAKQAVLVSVFLLLGSAFYVAVCSSGSDVSESSRIEHTARRADTVTLHMYRPKSIAKHQVPSAGCLDLTSAPGQQ